MRDSMNLIQLLIVCSVYEHVGPIYIRSYNAPETKKRKGKHRQLGTPRRSEAPGFHEAMVDMCWERSKASPAPVDKVSKERPGWVCLDSGIQDWGKGTTRRRPSAHLLDLAVKPCIAEKRTQPGTIIIQQSHRVRQNQHHRQSVKRAQLGYHSERK